MCSRIVNSHKFFRILCVIFMLSSQDSSTMDLVSQRLDVWFQRLQRALQGCHRHTWPFWKSIRSMMRHGMTNKKTKTLRVTWEIWKGPGFFIFLFHSTPKGLGRSGVELKIWLPPLICLCQLPWSTHGHIMLFIIIVHNKSFIHSTIRWSTTSVWHCWRWWYCKGGKCR